MFKKGIKWFSLVQSYTILYKKVRQSYNFMRNFAKLWF